MTTANNPPAPMQSHKALRRNFIAAILAPIALLYPCQPAAAASLTVDSDFRAPRFVQPSLTGYILLLPDGKFLQFFSTDTLADRPTGPLTRYLPDGTLDPSFRFSRDYYFVSAAAALPNGQVIVSATRTAYGALETEEILRLNKNGSIALRRLAPDGPPSIPVFTPPS